MATRETWTSSSSSTESRSHSEASSQSHSQSESTTQKVLDEALRDRILSGLMGYMTDEEIAQFAENLLRPQLNAGLEAAQQQYETAKLSREQELQSLAASLAQSIGAQQSAYRQSAADVQTAALARGMGRSSYTLQTLANQGDALAEAVRLLTEENERRSGQIQQQITQAAEQSAQTQGRLNTDYAASLAAKIQELRAQQQQAYNSQYLTAVSAAMGQKTTGTTDTQGTSQSDTQGSSQTESSSYSVTKTKSSGGSSSKKTTPDVDAVSSADPSVRR